MPLDDAAALADRFHGCSNLHLTPIEDTAQRRLRREQAVARGLAIDPEAAHFDAALIARVQAAVATLPPDYRAVVHLRFFEDRLPVAIADELGVPVETVRTRLKRAVERLRAALLPGRAARDAGQQPAM